MRARKINHIYCHPLRIALVFVLALAAAASPAEEKSSEDDGLKLLRERVRPTTLSNGLRVIFYRRGEAPVFSAVLAVRVGGTDEVPGETGISHLFEHMAFKGTDTIGTKDYPREKVLLDELEDIAARSDGAQSQKMTAEMKARWEEIQKELASLWVPEAYSTELEKRGAVGLNASTSSEVTQYYVSLPSKEFQFWCKMESDRMIHPVMRQFYKERDVVREEQRTRFEDDPGGKLLQQFYGIAFLAHPYRQPVIGYVQDIEHLTARKLEEFRRRFYVPGNMVLSLVGDVDPDRDIPVLEDYFGKIPAGPMPQRDILKEPPQEGERRATVLFNAEPQFFIGYKKPQFPDPDDAPISVMLQAIAGGKSSPLYRELVEQKKLATEVGADEGPGQAYPDLAIFYAEPRLPHTNEEVRAAFDSVINHLRAAGISNEDISISKRNIVVAYLEGMKSSGAIAEILASSELLHGSWKALIDWYEQVMKVDKKDVDGMAVKYLRPETRTVAMLEKKSGSRKGGGE